MTNTKFTLKREKLVDVAKEYNTKKILPMVVLLIFLIVLPSVIGIVFATPTEMYGRYNSFLFDKALTDINDYFNYSDLKIEIIEDSDGYIKKINVNESVTLGYEAFDIIVQQDEKEIIQNSSEYTKPTFIITENLIYFVDPNTVMALDSINFLASLFYDMDFTEIFEIIFLSNGYFTGFLPKMIGLILILSIVIIILFYLAMAISFSFYSREVKLTKDEMYKLLVFNSIIPVFISFFIGIFLPTIHIFFCQMMVAYNMHVSIKSKEKFIIKKNKESRSTIK